MPKNVSFPSPKQVGNLIQDCRIIGVNRAWTQNPQAHVEFGFRVQYLEDHPS